MNTLLLASIISSFITRHKIQNIQAVCSHGHTILHQPIKGITLQIGNLPMLSDLLGQTVVCDFSMQDLGYSFQATIFIC
jgi:anhydro-N-acetylmuramic acid kinase